MGKTMIGADAFQTPKRRRPRRAETQKKATPQDVENAPPPTSGTDAETSADP